MNISVYAKKIINSLLIGSLLSLSVQMPVTARMIDNNQIAAGAEVQQQRNEVKSILARSDIKQALLGYGVDSADVGNRVDSMTDSEVLQIHQHLSELPAGSSAAGTVLTVLLILILLEVLGVTNLFTRI